MHHREHYIARLEEVTITCNGEGAIVEYREKRIPTTHLQIGPNLVRMLLTYAGWGMRIEFVPEDEVHRSPAHVVREPDPKD